MKNYIKKLFGYCDVCGGVLGSHDRFEHSMKELIDLEGKNRRKIQVKLLAEIKTLELFIKFSDESEEVKEELMSKVKVLYNNTILN